MTRYAFPYGAFCIDAIPNQPQVAHCHSFFVHANQRGQGLGKLLKQQQCEVLKQQGFDFATCTTAGDNHRQHRVLESCGWRHLGEFANSCTGGSTILWGYVVKRGTPGVYQPPADINTAMLSLLKGRPIASNESTSSRVDCGECPQVTSGCEAGHCLKAQ